MQRREDGLTENKETEALAGDSLLERLPNELGAKVMTNLVPTQSNVMLVSRNLYAVFHSVDQRYWRDKFKRHFPHLYEAVNRKSDIDWRKEFTAAEDKEYANLGPRIRKLFHDIKEGVLVGIRQIENLTITDLLQFDSKILRAIDWASRICGQPILDYLFQNMVIPYFSAPDGNSLLLDKKDGLGRSALHWCVQCNQVNLIPVLIEQGFDVDLMDLDRVAPLFIAALNGLSASVPALIARGVNVNLAHNKGTTALMAAAQEGYAAVVECLLANGAEIDLTHSTGVTSIFLAAQEGRIAIVKCLAARGAEVNHAHSNGATPLFIAAQNGQSQVVACLLAENNIDVDAAMSTTASSLNSFVTANDADIAVKARMQRFIARHANPADIRMRPIDIARVMGHEDIVEMLQQKQDLLQFRHRLYLSC